MSQTKDIREAVERELSYDPLVDDSGISVKNINGDVALNGTVPSYPQYLEATSRSAPTRTRSTSPSTSRTR